MSWRLVTLALVATCIAGAAWVYMRDWDRPPFRYTERGQRAAQAQRAIETLARHCAGCRVDRLDDDDRRGSRIRVTSANASTCFSVDLDAFRDDAQTGVHGVRRVRC